MIREGEGDEPDLQFMYTALVIRHLLNLSSTTNTEVDGECASSSDSDDKDIDVHSAVK